MSIAKNSEPEKLAQLLHATAIRLLRTVRRADDSSGATAPRLSALSVIVFSGSITLGELAQAEQVRPPTMTRIVNALEEQQLIVKARDSEDGRSIRITATTKGKRFLLQGRARRIRLLVEQLAPFPKKERRNLSAALSTIHKLIEQINSEGDRKPHPQ